ncbi:MULTISPECIES: hypothetical protein [Methylomonas]|uniref:GIY-YIG domain-containing protein n=2 Tax=Methylomonas TaxID=416 RepID=A0A126T8P4_9GAMM|nr:MULTISPECIES: hypothetical protein [Methylomonas]AMK78455.1 hypothetical protein JT25_018485 [Methylomonas denitrificans]OAI04157.1 hypothetical protein A1342_06410 [Methylomonas methanica]TCV87514.1 hypothetical protein EDE11_10215 [Methylomonas methanica]
MASLDMQGAYDLSNAKINELITESAEGNYALGIINQKTNKFVVKYVGRSETDLNARLKQHVGRYPKFKFSYAASPKAAFEKVCQNYHDFGGSKKLLNHVHPTRPADVDWKCPCCNTFD